jgi:phosphatidylethanolamine-binding protein (PEBP) family uncharacterized protein
MRGSSRGKMLARTRLHGGKDRRPAASLPAAGLLSIVLLAGCGSGGSSSSPSSSAAVPASPALTATQGKVSKADAVAFVASTPIPKDSYRHWLSVEKALGGSANASHRALGFLITSQWVVGEAAARGISVSEGDVKKRLAELERQSFPKPGSLKKFLSKSAQTEADLLARIKVELLQSPVAAKATAGAKSKAQRAAALASFQKSFHAHWKRLTSCLPAYVMEDCKQYKGAPEAGLGTQASSSSSAAGGSSSSSRSGSTSSGSASSGASSAGEVHSRPGSFAISSPAFGLNGSIPAQYTCAGAGSSPPLSWEKVPAGASELVLFIIDDSSNGSSGGIRWIVGGIDPNSTGVAAGKLPQGGIVGTNTAGKATYSSICPDPGKSDTVEFVMYALRKAIPLSPGFQPATAEHEYGAGKDLLGQAAVTYAVASR